MQPFESARYRPSWRRRSWEWALVAAAVLAPGVAFSIQPEPSSGNPHAGQFPADPERVEVIRDFLGTGFGALHPQAPVETEAFGRLVGIWRAEQEYLQQDGSWEAGPPAYWIWKYAPGGFAVQDLWYQSKDALPGYLAELGRDYLLTATRIYDRNAGGWRVAWSANGAGQTPGADFGTFEAERVDGDVVMRTAIGREGVPPQRVTFHAIEHDSFAWVSEYSQDGTAWTAVMRVRATRVK